MSSKLNHRLVQTYRNLSLQNIITLPLLLQIFITVGLVGYFSWRNGEQAVDNFTSQLRNEVTAGVKTHLESYLETPHLIVKLKQNSIKAKQLNIANFPQIQQDFWSTIQLFDSVRAIYIGDEAGKFIYTKREQDRFYSKEVIESPQRQTYLLNNLGQKQELVTTDNYNPRLRPWYIKTMRTKANNWSNIYTFTGGELGITAAGLVRDNQGNIQGIVGVDLILGGIDRFLRSLEISKNGRVFILERNGYLIATSTKENPFIIDTNKGTEERLRGIESENLLVKATTNYITSHFRSLYNINAPQQLEFSLNNDNQLVQVVPYKDNLGIDWLIVVVLPEADFMAEIDSNTRNTIWLCLLALAIATILGVYTSRRIASPIANLSQIANMVAQSARAKNTSTNFYPIVKAKSIREIKLLARSFNEMVIQLKAAFKDLENYNETLEKQVNKRTKALVTAKEAADAANRAKSQFLANMSHELRTPLHAILGFTQIALQDNSLKPQQRENLLTVKRSGEHLLTLINDVLEMSKVEAGSLSIDQQQFDLYLLLENLGKMFRLRSQLKRIQLAFHLSPDLPRYVETDPVKLNQILINLIENAIKFTEKGGVSVQIRPIIQSEATEIVFIVKDTGHGILPSELESIFIPFTQARQSDREGTGLGLAICQQFVRLLGGEITVSSFLGRGSTFEFQIPVTVLKDLSIADNYQEQPIKHSDLTLGKQTRFPTPSQPVPLRELEPMHQEWIERLHEAAISIDSDLINQLIAQIPSAQSNLIQELNRMVKNFEYDEMMELAEQELTRRKKR